MALMIEADANSTGEAARRAGFRWALPRIWFLFVS